MVDQTPFWDQLHDTLQDELSVLRTILGKIGDIERAGQLNQPLPSPLELEENWEALKKVQKRRFEQTKNVTQCSDYSLQDDFFTNWLEKAEDDLDTATLWEQIQVLSMKISEQLEKSAPHQLKVQPKEEPKQAKHRLDTLDTQ